MLRYVVAQVEVAFLDSNTSALGKDPIVLVEDGRMGQNALSV